MTIAVLRPGLLTTVQDLGRHGHQHEGVPESGAMDAHAARLANLLAGNDENAALLEATLDGPTLRFDHTAYVALAGAEFDTTVDGSRVAPWSAFPVAAGATLELRRARIGCRAYVAVSGGIDVPRVLGSRSTLLVAKFGGLDGRALRAGDVLPIGGAPHPSQRRALGTSYRPAYSTTLRVTPGAEQDALDVRSARAVYAEPFRVSPRSDRMGYRLEGPSLALCATRELLSAGVPMGTVQLPPGGAPILLMADHQTTGGYPVIAHVATVDLGSAAQLRPGDEVRFRAISLDEAQSLYLERERSLVALRRALSHSR